AVRPLVGQNDVAAADHGYRLLAVSSDTVPSVLLDGGVAILGYLHHRRRLAAIGQSRLQRCLAVADVGAVPGRHPRRRRCFRIQHLSLCVRWPCGVLRDLADRANRRSAIAELLSDVLRGVELGRADRDSVAGAPATESGALLRLMADRLAGKVALVTGA